MGPDPGERQMVGRGLPVPPCPPTPRVSAWVMAQGTARAGVLTHSHHPVPPAKGSGQHNLACKGATNPTAMLRLCPRTHQDPDTPSPWLCPSWSWCREHRGGRAQQRPSWQPRGVAGLGRGTGTPGLGWLHILFTSAGGRRRVPKGTSGSGSRWTKPSCQQAPGSPNTPPRQLLGDPSPMGRDTPKWGAHSAWGSP